MECKVLVIILEIKGWTSLERRCHRRVITSNVGVAVAKKNERSKGSKADFNPRCRKFREEYVGPFLKK